MKKLGSDTWDLFQFARTIQLEDPERIEALAATGLLDSLPEECFDRVTRMAARTGARPWRFSH